MGVVTDHRDVFAFPHDLEPKCLKSTYDSPLWRVNGKLRHAPQQ